MVDVVKRQSLTLNGATTGRAACSNLTTTIYLRDYYTSESNWHIREYDTVNDVFSWISQNSSFTGFTNFGSFGDIEQFCGPVYFKDNVYVAIYNRSTNVDYVGVARYSGSGTTWNLVYEVATDDTSNSGITGLLSDGTRIMIIYSSGTMSDSGGGWRVAHSTTGNVSTWTDVAFTETTDVYTYMDPTAQGATVYTRSYNNIYDISPQYFVQLWENAPSPTKRSIRLFEWDGTTFDEIAEAHRGSPAIPPTVDTGDVWLAQIDEIGTSYIWGADSGNYEYVVNKNGTWLTTNDGSYYVILQNGWDVQDSLLELGYDTAESASTVLGDMASAGTWSNTRTAYSSNDLDFYISFKFQNDSEWFVCGRSPDQGVWALSTAAGEEPAAATTSPRFYYGINELVERLELPFTSGVNWGAMALTTLDEIVVGSKTGGDAIMTAKMVQSNDFSSYEDITPGISTTYDIETIRNV